MLKTILSVLLSKQSRLWFHQSKLSLFRPFLFSSKLDHTTLPDLLLVIEARRYERTSFILLKIVRILQYILPSSALFAKQLEERQEDFRTGTDLRIGQIGHGLGPRATLSYDGSILTKNLRNCAVAYNFTIYLETSGNANVFSRLLSVQ